MNVDEIVSKMSLRQKVEFLSGDGEWHTKALSELGVEAVSMSDGPNGLRIEKDQVTRDSLPATCYPSMSALASTWDRDLARRMAQDLAEECRAAGLDMLLGPGVNIKRSPLCGRNFEYFSEDPYVASEMACAYVSSLQENHTSACLKHFAVNNQEFCRMTVDARVGQRALREIYLKCFEKTVKEAQPHGVMSAYNLLNGEQMANSPLLRQILREEWGFRGTVISDWGSVSDRAKSTAAGMDLEMPDSHGYFDGDVYRALENGTLQEAQIDACVGRILRLVQRRMELRQPPRPYDPVRHHALAREIAARSAVLLKNEAGILPLKRSCSLAVIGEMAQAPRYQGEGAAHVHPENLEIPLEELRKAFPHLTYSAGYRMEGESSSNLAEQAVEAAKAAETVVLFAGLPEMYEAECYDRVDLELPAEQNTLIGQVAAVNPNTVVVLFTGSAVRLPWLSRVRAVLLAHLPGEAVGSALTDVLTGDAEPSGRLTETFPMRLEDTPSFGNFPGNGDYVDYAEGIYVGYRWYDKRKIEPQFCFGEGMGYTTFAYGTLECDRDSLGADAPVQLRLRIRNTGNRTGREVVQLYASQDDGRWGYVRQLKGFETVELAPGEETQVSFRIRAEDLAVWSERKQDFYVQDGMYTFEAAHHSRDIRSSVRVCVAAGDYEPAPMGRNVNVSDLLADPRTEQLGRRVYEGIAQARQKIDAGYDLQKIERLGQSPFRTYPARNFIDQCGQDAGRALEQRVYDERKNNK